MKIDLTRVREMLASPEWWVTAIFAGLVMSVVAAYVKQGVDRILVVSSKTWRDFRRSQKERREDRIALASEDAHFFLSLFAREMRVRFRLVCYLVGAVGLYMIAVAFVFGGGGWRWYANLASALLVLWMAEWWTLLHVRYEVYEAERLHRQRHPRKEPPPTTIP